MFVDGVMNDSLTWAYPKSVFSAASTEYVLGSEDSDAQMSWCIATAYLISLPIGDDLPRFIHHLGPRYQGNFQDPSLIKFLTYEASTSLNMFLTAVASKGSAVESLSLMKAVRDGLGLNNSAIVFSLSCLNLKQSGSVSNIPMSTSSREFNVRGDVLVVKAACLDLSLWKIGGTAIPLHLLQLAKVVLRVFLEYLRSHLPSRPMKSQERSVFSLIAFGIVGRTQKTWSVCVGCF